jgi:hypothetical protein
MLLSIGKVPELVPVGYCNSSDFETIKRLRCSIAFSFRLPQDLTHVTVMYDSHMTILPGDRDRVPARGSHNAAIIDIASPINGITLLELLGFGGGHNALSAARAFGMLTDSAAA